MGVVACVPDPFEWKGMEADFPFVSKGLEHRLGRVLKIIAMD